MSFFRRRRTKLSGIIPNFMSLISKDLLVFFFYCAPRATKKRHSMCIHWADSYDPAKRGDAQSLTRCGARFSVAGGRNRPSARHLFAGPWSLGIISPYCFLRPTPPLTRSADGLVNETIPDQGFWLIDVAAIKDDCFAHQPPHQFKIRMAELLPLGDNRQAVGSFESAVGPVAVNQPVAINGPHIGQRLGIVDPQCHAVGQEGVDQHQSRRLADIIGAWLESEAPDRDGFLLQRGAIVLAN